MAEDQVRQVLEKEVTCPLCLDLFKDPKKLPCDHIYCKECLRSLALRSLNATISCPECRTLTQVPGNDVNSFATAFRINRLIEAFQQVQVKVETDHPNITESVCGSHPRQALALYCETCKKQLCRDCVLMTREHTDHQYGFFKEVTPNYRTKLVSELSLIKTQDLSILNALADVTSAETSVSNHVVKCQNDIDSAFEGMMSVLHACKLAMKDEATAYYSSLTGVFEQRREQLNDIQSNVQSVITSIDATLQDDDQSFLVRMESTFERISNLQEKFKNISLTIAKPRLITVHTSGANSLRHYLKGNCFICELAQANMCSFDSSFANAVLYVDKQTFTLILCISSGELCQDGENKVDVKLINAQGSSTTGNVETLSHGQVNILLMPQSRGLHQLIVKVNDAHIKDSPFTVTVYMPPSLLSQPVATISGLGCPRSLICSQDKIRATEMLKDRIIEIDSDFHVQEIKQLSGVYELTEDCDLNMYVTTGNHHQLIKISSTGNVIKRVDKLGKRNAEFDFPTGLRVNKKSELYVCDSRNSRIQIFDLNLKFKRSFGKYGSGKGQFNFPADVDFDSSGNVYITDTNNYRIQVFTCTEHHIRSIGVKKAAIFRPASLLVHNENVYVTDCHNNKVWVMNTASDTVATFGGDCLSKPEGIAMDKAGFIYVTSDSSKIVKF